MGSDLRRGSLSEGLGLSVYRPREYSEIEYGRRGQTVMIGSVLLWVLRTPVSAHSVFWHGLKGETQGFVLVR